ncbi:hypothetical protein EX895_005723 [Sporisorium graminicola]|uniref:Methyltransferase domain-containing protein n=1 Tax=Sporisorium graminicola TaxID=280036 RepID=A0A4U7KMP4_9BASI|nr:hypothetical protein EX895_005723 [Sporisorium graminicola]TKY85561.1 hypothetical protein EX895_005723 [Sporisorium graminicola]
MSLTAERNEQFSEREYWEQRYADESEQDFDWFKTYDDLKDVFDDLIPNRTARILMLGCGNSTLSPSMHTAGYTNIVNIDYSTTLIQRLTARFPDQTFLVQDITTLHHPSSLTLLGGAASFDVALDKGTMDALMAEGRGASPWNPGEKVVRDVRQMLKGVDTVLRPGGKLIYITFGQPHFRRRWLEEVDGWHVETRTLGDMFHYFVYVATKKA